MKRPNEGGTGIRCVMPDRKKIEGKFGGCMYCVRSIVG